MLHLCENDLSDSFKPLKTCGHCVHINCLIENSFDCCPICNKKVKFTKNQKKKLEKNGRIF